MSYVRCLRGVGSGVEYDANQAMNLDPVDSRPVEMVLDIERLSHQRPGAAWYDPTRRDLWRFGALMALDIADPNDARHIVALGEGHTPLLDYRTHPLAQAAGLALQMKDEGQAHAGWGANPTGSFKDWFSVATFQEPGWRIEGKKSLGLELAEPAAGETRWSLPDAVIYPTGGGTGVLGMWKAWDELEALGMIDARRPRMLCVQSEVTAPLVRAFESGVADTTLATPGNTLAFGLNVPGGVGHFRVLQILRASNGAAVEVSEAEISAELVRDWRERRAWVCPEGAACLAALPQLLDRGLLRRGERVVAVNTGSLEKYLPALRHLL